MSKVFIITGAGHFPGIGSETAVTLLEQGHCVVVNSRSFDPTWQNFDPAQLRLVPGDITDPTIQDLVIKTAVDAWGQIDGLVNNASTGRAEYDELNLLTRQSWHENFLMNAVVVYEFSHRLRPWLEKTTGSIVNISSRAAIQPGAGNSVAYAVSKSAMIRLSNELAIEFAPTITVNTICPGFVETYRMKKMLGDNYKQRRETWESSVPLGRTISTKEVADAIIHLLTNRAITGECISIMGGAMAHDRGYAIPPILTNSALG